jgi:hypothetical protein
MADIRHRLGRITFGNRVQPALEPIRSADPGGGDGEDRAPGSRGIRARRGLAARLPDLPVLNPDPSVQAAWRSGRGGRGGHAGPETTL